MTKRKGCGCFSLVVFLLIIALLVGVGLKNKDKIIALFYPIEYEETITQYCDQYGVDKWLVLALIKEESGFDPDAVSSAGAHGLMQLMSETAEWLINQGGFAINLEDALHDPEDNIHLGVYYLSLLFNNYGDENNPADSATVIAAYNAGIGSVTSWLEDGTWDGTLESVDNIPYPETEKHVRSVLRSYEKYRELYAGETVE